MKQHTEKQQEKPQIYVYVGDGLGIPGLPHVVSIALAEALGMSDVLQGAIKNGTYIPKPNGGE